MQVRSFNVGFDCSALDPGFKAHAGRGIGRYVSELVKYFEKEGLFGGNYSPPNKSMETPTVKQPPEGAILRRKIGGGRLTTLPQISQDRPGLDQRCGASVSENHRISGIKSNFFPEGRVVTFGVSVSKFDHKLFNLPRPVENLIDILPRGRQTIRQQLCYPIQLHGKRTSQFDILHFPAHMDAPSWSFKPYIITVLDLIPLVLKELYRPTKADIRFAFARWLELRAIQGAAHVIAISECTARDCERILGIPRERISVTHLGVDERFFGETTDLERREARSKLGIAPDRPVLLYVGGIDERKNVGMLVSIFADVIAALREQGSQVLPQLVMAGGIENDRNYPALLQSIRSNGLLDDVVLTGYVSESDILSLYQTSKLFLFPSLYEGFGLPPLEALAAGVMVVSSNTSSMPEVLGDVARLCDPNNKAEWVATIIDLLSMKEEERRDVVVKSRAHARNWSWDKTGRATVNVYESLNRG